MAAYLRRGREREHAHSNTCSTHFFSAAFACMRREKEDGWHSNTTRRLNEHVSRTEHLNAHLLYYIAAPRQAPIQGEIFRDVYNRACVETRRSPTSNALFSCIRTHQLHPPFSSLSAVSAVSGGASCFGRVSRGSRGSFLVSVGMPNLYRRAPSDRPPRARADLTT